MGLDSEFFTGKEFSTTPLETQGLATDLAAMFSKSISTPGGGRLGAQGIADTFGVDIGSLGLGDLASTIAGGGTSRSLQAFDNANRPFQQRAINQGASQAASSFGTAGGRFSNNLLGAQGRQRAEQESQFNRDRFNFFDQARQSDIAALSGVLGGIQGMQAFNLAPVGIAANFGQPGPVGFQEGALGEILGAVGTLGGAAIGNPAAFAGIGRGASSLFSAIKGIF